MRLRFLFLAFCFCFWNCEDKQSQQNNVSDAKDSISKTKVDSVITPPSSKDSEPKREFPKLTEKNAMEFFLQYEKEHKENKVRMYTDFGNIDILLFNETKFHRANFIFLTKQGYFDNTQFYRVIDKYIVQGGSTDERDVMRRRKYIGRYLLPTDTKRGFKHDRGVISMPSSDIDNPHKLASPYEFFITLRDVYQLDGDYTIFGKVIRGLDVCDKIAKVETDNADWPLQNVYIRKVEIIE